MSRLTIKDKELYRWGNLLPKANSSGDQNAVGIQLADSIDTPDIIHSYYIGKAVDKLADLEDVLEEFNIESVQELKARLQSESQLSKAGYELALENEELTKQLSKAIVPKFKTYQPIFYITQYYTSTKGVPEYDIIKDKYYVAENENEIILGWNYTKDFNQRKYFYVRKDWVFATKSEAEQKLKELEEKEW